MKTVPPERIWLDDVEHMHAFPSSEDCEGCHGGKGIEYVRASIYAALTSERDRLRAEVSRLNMILAARDAFDRGEPSDPPHSGHEKAVMKGDAP